MSDTIIFISLLILLVSICCIPFFVLWTLNHCFHSKLPFQRKCIWTVLMIGLCPLGSVFYAAIKPRAKRTRYLLGVYTICTMTMMFILLITCNLASRELVFRIADSQKQIQNTDFRGLSASDKHRLLDALELLKKESAFTVKNVLYHPRRLMLNLLQEQAHMLLDLLDDYTRDDKLSREELYVWHTAFEKRYTTGFALYTYNAYQISNMPMTFTESKLVLQTYFTINKPHVTFDITQARMRSPEVIYLRELLKTIDFCVIERVRTLEWFQSGGVRGQPYDQYVKHMRHYMTELVALSVPDKFKNTHKIIISVLDDENRFYLMWQKAFDEGLVFQYNLRPNSRIAPLVLAIHDDLHKAFASIGQLFPNMSGQTNDAIWSHFSALGFL